MSTNCDACGYRDNEVKSGSAISAQGKKITLKVEDSEDLSRDILKVWAYFIFWLPFFIRLFRARRAVWPSPKSILCYKRALSAVDLQPSKESWTKSMRNSLTKFSPVTRAGQVAKTRSSLS
jgi:hypothetical protein